MSPVLATPPERRPILARALVSGLATLVAVGLAWRVLGRSAAPVAFVAQAAEVDALLAERRAAGGAQFPRYDAQGRLLLEPMDAAVARTLFVMPAQTFEYDPARYYRYLPQLERGAEWPEHPDGHWTRRTNGAGLREDDELRLGDVELSVLVTGDSHTDGVCNNAESFTNQLEARLAARHPERSVGALNVGLVGYSFFNYLGVLRGHLDPAPDVFVVAVYGGNDFLEALRPFHWFRGTEFPRRPEGYRERVERAQAVSTASLAQGLNQVMFLSEFPDQVELAIEAMQLCVTEIRRECDARGVRLVVVYIPPAYEVGWTWLDAMLGAASDELGLDAGDFDVARRLAQALFATLDALGVDGLDATAWFAEAPGPCYWERDLHIDLEAQALIAERLDEHLAAGGGRLRPPRELHPDGPFVERNARGQVLVEGLWLAGRRHGRWIESWPTGGVRSEGDWRAGERDGEWSFYHPNGVLHERGEYSAGRRVGVWTEWHEGGSQARAGEYLDGQPHGLWREHTPQGVLVSEGSFLEGQRQGPWTTWRPDGSLLFYAEYERGTMHGAFRRVHVGGEVQAEGEMRGGARSGRWTMRYQDGTLRAEGAYVAGERHGPWRYFSEQGVLDPETSGTYAKDARVGE